MAYIYNRISRSTVSKASHRSRIAIRETRLATTKVNKQRVKMFCGVVRLIRGMIERKEGLVSRTINHLGLVSRCSNNMDEYLKYKLRDR